MPIADEEEAARAQSRLGTVLRGKYRLDRVLGIGAMAAVYAATHRNTKRFAIKMLHGHLSGHREIRTRFQREGYVANQVQHPGAVTVLDDDVAEDGSAFLVMELLEGWTVEDLWERHGRRLPLDVVLGVGYQILDVLASAHARRIVHRDIKPANLFLTVNGQVKVLDFGIASLRDATSSLATNAGSVLGTPAFMSPEQALATPEEIDAQSDVWAVGAVLFTLASGRIVHEADNAQRILIRAATFPADSLASVLPEAHPEIVELIDRALAFNKSMRWPTAGMMQIALGATSGVVLDAPPSPEMLARFLADDGQSMPPPRAAPSGPDVSDPTATKREVDARTERVSDSPGAPSLPAATAGGKKLAGLITEQPVVARDRFGVTSLRHRSLILWVGGALGLLLVGSSIMLALSDKSAANGAPPAVSAAQATPSAVASAATTPPRPVVSASSASEPPLISVDQLPLAQTAQAPAQRRVPPAAILGAPTAPPPSAAAGTPLPPNPSPGATASAAPPVSATPPRPAHSTSKPSCDPPFSIDAQGDKKWKLECL